MVVHFYDGSNCDTCQKCGHSYDMHYHDEACWELQTEKETLTDDKMKRQFLDAKSDAEAKLAAAGEIERRLKASEQRKDAMSKSLVNQIMTFQSHAVSSSYMKLITQQINVVKMHIEVAQREGHDTSSLQRTQDDLEKQLTMVQGVLKECWKWKDSGFKRQWACLCLDVEEGATRAQVEKAFRDKSFEHHPDKGGDELLYKALGHAKAILLGKA